MRGGGGVIPLVDWRNSSSRAGLCLAAFVFALALAQPAFAADITVNATCSISDAIKAAENDTATGGCAAGSGADTITLSQNATLTEDPPEFRTDITIEGAGYSISGNDQYTFFDVHEDGSLTLNKLTLKEGKGGNYYLIVVYGDFTMTNSALVDSETDSGWALIGLAPTTSGKEQRINNSTIVSPANVFGVYVGGGSPANIYLDHVTIIGDGYDALYAGDSAAAQKVHLRNSLLTGPDRENETICWVGGHGPFKDTRGSFVRDLTCGICTGGNPMLGSFTGSPGYYPLRSDSPAKDIGAASICAAYPKDQAGEDRPATNCNAGAVEAEYDLPPNSTPALANTCPTTTSPARVASSDKSVPRVSKAWSPTPTRLPFSTCEDFTQRIIVRGYNVGTQCQEVGALGIGNAEVLAGGYIYALDVWGYLGAGVQVCFDKPGTALSLDAATAPRQIVPLSVYRHDGHSCVDLRRAGTVVLQPGAPSPSGETAAGAEAGWALSRCMARLNGFLNFRESPGGAVKGVLRPGIALTALRRTEGWIYVDHHGDRGWVSASWVTLLGDCA